MSSPPARGSSSRLVGTRAVLRSSPPARGSSRHRPGPHRASLVVPARAQSPDPPREPVVDLRVDDGTGMRRDAHQMRERELNAARARLVLPSGVLAGFSLAENREVDLADNPRFTALAARLGVYERAVQSRLRGDVLVLGCAAGPRDDDVPPQVIEACARCGIDVRPASVFPATGSDTGRAPPRGDPRSSSWATPCRGRVRA